MAENMETALDLADSELGGEEAQFLAQVREHGWFNTRVFDEAGALPSFSYSTGIFSRFAFPEVVIFSLSKETSHAILWDVFRNVEAGEIPPIGSRASGILGNADAFLLPVAKSQYREYLGWSRWFYRGDEFPCLQLVWPDTVGSFPWEAGFDPRFADDQPDLTVGNWSGLS